jgi:hypothetical protein
MTETTPVQDTVAKVNNELAVGDDLDFQRRWWRFERVVWLIFLLIVVADLLGCFGRGWLAHAETRTADNSAAIQYERVERFSTPSILSVSFAPNAVRAGHIQLWMSESLLKPLGNQRIIPQPLASVLDKGGILYTFDAAARPSSVEFAMEPAKPGIFPLTLRVNDSAPVTINIYVMP